MTDWLSHLEQLDIPDGAVAGLSNADKPIIEGKLLQPSAGDRPLFIHGQQIDVLKRLRTLLPDMPAGQTSHTASFLSCCLVTVTPSGNQELPVAF